MKTSADGGFRRTVTGGDFRLWSCVLAAWDEDRHSLVHFTVTQEPALVGLHRADDKGRSTLLTCAGRPTLVQVGHFFGAFRPASRAARAASAVAVSRSRESPRSSAA
ncbi:hypothetical protein ACIP5L_07045 [Streptomyces bacillaris]|uniref:hypothetical protein n=1 Tax=Streptomyces bacillaris TaxID=68179 RepID=UPI0037F139BF